MRDITFRASPAWTIHPLLCNDVLAERITIESGQFDGDKEYTGHNVDGFDPDSCTNVVLRDSHIHAGDDCVAMLGGTDARVSCPRTKQILRRGGYKYDCVAPALFEHSRFDTSCVRAPRLPYTVFEAPPPT